MAWRGVAHATAPSFAPSPISPVATSRRRASPRRDSQQRSRCSGSPSTRASSGGTSVHLSNSCGQRGRKWHPSGAVGSDGGSPAMAGRRSGRGAVDARDRPEQPPRVRVLRVVEDLVERALLDDPPGVHDRHPVGDVRHHAEVVGHEDHGRAGLVAQVASSARGSAPGSSRRARWSARRRSACSGRTTAPSRSSRAGACRRRTRAGRSRPARAARGMPDPLEQLDRPLARLLRSRCRSCARICSTICVADLDAPGSATSSGPGRSSRSPRRARLAGARRRRVDQVARPCSGAEPSKRAFGRAREAHQRHRGDGLAGPGLPHDREDLALARARKTRRRRPARRPPRSRTTTARSRTLSRGSVIATGAGSAGRARRRGCPRRCSAAR